jgi:hypothetical protein
MVSVNDLAPWGGTAMMLLVWYLSHRRDHAKEDRAAAGLAAVDRVRLAKIDGLEATTNQHLLDCAQAHTRHTCALEALTEAVGRLDRSVGQLQAQIRNVATDSADTLFVRGKGR